MKDDGRDATIVWKTKKNEKFLQNNLTRIGFFHIFAEQKKKQKTASTRGRNRFTRNLNSKHIGKWTTRINGKDGHRSNSAGR